MKKGLHLIMPMAGGGVRFENEGYEMPKPLIMLHGFPFFYWATKSIYGRVTTLSLTFVVLKEHVEVYEIDKKIYEFFPDAKIIVIPEVLPGAVLTCREGVKDLPDREPVIFNDCDHVFRCREFEAVCKEKNGFDNIDGGLLTFESQKPCYSYISLGENGYVNRTVEKQVISTSAICGAYLFRSKNTFLETCDKYLDKCNYSEYFMSGLYNILIEENRKIKRFSTDIHISFGTPQEYLEAKEIDFSMFR